MAGLLLPVCSIFFSGLLCFIYFSKERIDITENKMYSNMIVCSVIDSILVSILQILALNGVVGIEKILVNLFNKLDFLFLIVFCNSLLLYTLLITLPKFKDNFKKYFTISIFIDLVFAILIFLSKVQVISIGENYSVQGTSINLTYILCFTYIAFSIITVLLNIKKADRRHIPIFVIMAMIFVLLIIFKLNPYLIIISIVITFVDYVMYFTIENPDMKMIEELNIAKKEADVANNAKTEFLANMSHEIRTPLNAITGFSQALAEEEGMPEAAKEDIKDIIMASNSLLEIVNGVLDISKIEAGKIEIINKTYNPFDMFRELESLTRVRIGEKPIELRVYIDATIPKILYGDHVRIKQIILNLLTNAAKYTEEGYIDFKVSSVIKEDVCRLIISVEDTGMGIKSDQVDKLFNKFSRLDEEKNITIEGTGLGLAITKKLLELMHGKITVQSIYGEGSKFTAYIDQKIVPEENTHAETEEAEVVEELVGEESKVENTEKKKVLVVDDNKLNLKVAQKLLAKYNLDITTLESGMECIEHIGKKEQYDLILLDDMMPKMNGKETLKKLKEDENFKIPTIALTANAISGVKEEYLALGFDDYLAKPIEKIELERVLKKYLNL